MKRLFPLIFLLPFALSACSDDKSSQADDGVIEQETSLTDSRDGQTYRVVSIGSQAWLAENLNYETPDSYCYDNIEANCDKYGRLYTWNAALTACPNGWHLPSKAEFEKLASAVGGESVAAKKLKSTSGWNESGDALSGVDEYAFSALPAGGRISQGAFSDKGNYAGFWTSTEHDGMIAYYELLNFNFDKALVGANPKEYAFSVRCVKD